MDNITRIKELVSQLNQYRNSYYNENNSLISDAEYDKLFDELQRIEKETGFILSNSPTRSVGYEVKSKLEKIQHSIPLLSLDKSKQVDDIVKFKSEKELIGMLKLDGLTVKLIYDKGHLIQASTRGNGTEGEDITHNAKTFKNLPLTISDKNYIELSGEAIIHFDDFKNINSKLPKDEQYKTPRNLVSGSVRQLDSKECSNRCVKFYAYNILKKSGIQNKAKSIELVMLKSLGFDIVPYGRIEYGGTKENIELLIKSLKGEAEKRHIPIDGIVFTHNDKEYGESLGKTSHHPLHSIAFKFADETAVTTLRDIEWSIGRTGVLTPVGIFDTVELDGTEVSRASLHNLSIIESLQLGIGDEIVVQKANMIIPQIIDNKTRSNAINFNTKCPFCSHPTEVVQENESKVLMCVNPDCKGKLLSKFAHFASKPAMNIEGLSEATLEKFIEAGWLKTFVDIYRLNEHKDDIVKLDGFGKRLYEKLWSAIEQSKNTTLDRFLVSLGIPQIGRSASKVISKRFNGDWLEFNDAGQRGFSFTELEDFGETMNKSIRDYFNNHTNYYNCTTLLNYLNLEKQSCSDINVVSKINGMTFAITGNVEHYKNRDELKGHIESLGGKVSGSVSAKTDCLINNDITSTSGKNAKAKSLGVKIISENDFMEMIK